MKTKSENQNPVVYGVSRSTTATTVILIQPWNHDDDSHHDSDLQTVLAPTKKQKTSIIKHNGWKVESMPNYGQLGFTTTYRFIRP